jgi:hypothetical protein
MRIMGVDLHTQQQTIAMLDTETGELVEKILEHDGDEVWKFYSTPRPSPGRDRSHRIDALVSGAAGKTTDRPSGRRSDEDPQSGDPQAKQGCARKKQKTEEKTLDTADVVRDDPLPSVG